MLSRAVAASEATKTIATAALLSFFLFRLQAMTPDALATALAALERERSPAVAVTSPSPVSSRLHGQPHGSTTATQYYATPSMPIKWRLSESYVSEDDIPLNLGAEKLPNDEEGHWGAHGFKLPRRTNTHYQRAPRRNGLEVDWDCGIW